MATSLSLTNFSVLLASKQTPSQVGGGPSFCSVSGKKVVNKFAALVLGGSRDNAVYPSSKSGFNVEVVVEDNEPEEMLLNRFRREVMRAGVIQECKRRRFYETKQEEKKRKAREASKRNRRRRPQSRPPFASSEAEATAKVDDDDNWDLPQGTM